MGRLAEPGTDHVHNVELRSDWVLSVLLALAGPPPYAARIGVTQMRRSTKVAVVLLGCFAGCGDDGSDTGGNAAAGSAAASTGGTSGAAGIAGSAGMAGVAGAAGTGGLGGAAGTAGTSGSGGAAGMAGTSGSGGAGGAAGTAGAGGAAGSAGTGGSAGAAGGAVVRVHYDTGVGNSITLRGSNAPLNWTTGAPCTWTAGHVWECGPFDFTAMTAFKPLVNDATWAPGYNYLVDPGEHPDIFPLFFDSSGELEIIDDFPSTALGNTRSVAVFLPPGYDENLAKTYPILIMHDGQNLFDAATSAFGVEWQVDEALTDLVFGNGIVEPIIVAPYNTADRIDEYTPTFDADVGGGGNGDLYLDFIVDELLPWVRTNYRTEGTKVGMAGSSLGGLITLYGCWTRPTQFDRCGVFSPSLWWDNQALLSQIASDPAPPQGLRIYLDSGDSGPSNDGMTDTITLRDVLVTDGWTIGDDLLYVLGVGQQHNESAWAARAPGALEFLYHDPRRAPQ